MRSISKLLLITFIGGALSCSTVKNYSESYRNNYSQKLGIELNKDFDPILIKEVIGWLGTPYKYGGTDKSGTDCSGFVMQVYKTVYSINTARSANGLYEACQKISRLKVKQGQLVFFKINTEKVGHVGIFIQDPYFIHASSSKGVMVSSLDENYWTKYFISCGKLGS